MFMALSDGGAVLWSVAVALMVVSAIVLAIASLDEFRARWRESVEFRLQFCRDATFRFACFVAAGAAGPFVAQAIGLSWREPMPLILSISFAAIGIVGLIAVAIVRRRAKRSY
jgi:hypothetical protein